MARIFVTVLAVALLSVPGFLVAPEDADMTFTLGAPRGGSFEPRIIEDAPFFTAAVSGGAEPAILVDALGRAILVGDHLGVYRSTNGGVTWTTVTPPFIPGNAFGTGIFDGWALAQDAAGTIYASTTDGPVINVASSTDGGATWQLGASTFLAEASPLIADRPWLAAKGNGIVAMTWNDGGSSQRCIYSTDSALTFTQRTLPLLTSAAPIGGLPAWDAQGRLIFAGNGGIGGGAGTLYRYPNPPCGTSVIGLALPPAGAQLSTQVVADAAGNYLARPSADNTAMQLLGLPGFTLTGAKTLTVSPPTQKGATFGTIAIRPGEIAVAWYGTTTPGNFQSPPFAGSWNVYVARVKDFWSATPTIEIDQVTATPNHVGDFCFGGTGCDLNGNGDRDLLDYWQMTYDSAGALHLAYGHDGATSNAEVRYAKLPAWN